MVSVQNPTTGSWTILTSDTHDKVLVAIDPLTGNAVHLMDTDEKYEGLCMTPDDRLLGNTEHGLWEIDIAARSESELGEFDGDYGKVESLEYAFGDNSPVIDATSEGVPAAWTDDGLLFAFDDDSNALMLMDPASGNAIDYVCSFSTVDCEGLVFTTKNRDPYGAVVAEPCD